MSPLRVFKAQKHGKYYDDSPAARTPKLCLGCDNSMVEKRIQRDPIELFAKSLRPDTKREELGEEEMLLIEEELKRCQDAVSRRIIMDAQEAVLHLQPK